MDETRIRIGDAVAIRLGAGISLELPATTVQLQDGVVASIDPPGGEIPAAEPNAIDELLARFNGDELVVGVAGDDLSAMRAKAVQILEVEEPFPDAWEGGADFVLATRSHLARFELSPAAAPAAWAFPVGSEKYPIEKWYCAQYHTYDPGPPPSGHTGLDLNVQVLPKGDVDRGQPVFAVSEGTVTSAGYSNTHQGDWLGCVVLRVVHEGQFLWVRYGHLAQEGMASEGQVVSAGDQLGVIGNYTGGAGGDHVHFDAALGAFEWSWYRSNTVHWVDPLPILRAHLDNDLVDRMLADEGG